MSWLTPTAKIRTLSDCLAQGSDNFLLLRFIAASMVIYGHAPAISGGGGPKDLFIWLRWGTYSGSIAVDIFFIVSGFLITGSFVRRRNVVDFIWARILRIMPAYTVCVTLCALVFGALLTQLSLSIYLQEPGTTGYILKNVRLGLDLAWDLPGVFQNNPRMNTVHGSIWTLPAEVRMYEWVAILGVAGMLFARRCFNFTLAALLLFGLNFPENIPLVPHPAFVRFAALFAVGGFCSINRSWIPVHGGFLLALIVLAYVFQPTGAYPYLFALAETAFVFWFAYALKWYGFNRFGDYSYGIYLWGFPAQQWVASLAGHLPDLVNALYGFLVALILAIGSWHLVEKPMLRLKGVPARMLRPVEAMYRKSRLAAFLGRRMNP